MTNISSGSSKQMFDRDGLSQPVVSIVMPIIAIDRFFEATLASIEAQTMQDFELLLVCDEIRGNEIRSYMQARSASSLRWRIVATTMQGFSFALNLGIAEAKGEFIARWDADDLCDADRLFNQVEAFRSNPRLAVLGTRAVLIDSMGGPIPFHNFRFYGSDARIRAALKYRQPIVHSSLMMPRRLLLSCGGYQFGYASEDHAMFIRLTRKKDIEFRNLDNVYCYYRRHEEQLSGRRSQFEQFCDIAGFMIIEFLRTGNPMYLVGAIANLPLAREFRRACRAFLRRVAVLVFPLLKT